MKKVLDGLVKSEVFLASLILAALIMCTFLGVIARYVFSRPFTWEEEFQLACMVWISFLAAPAAFHTKSHVAIEIVVDLFPEKVQRAVDILIAVLVFGILLFTFSRSVSFIRVIAATKRATPILRVPSAYVYGIAPVSIILMLVSYACETFAALKGKGGAE